MNMSHTITMNPPLCDAVRLQEKGGPLDTDNLFEIGSTEPKETKSGAKMFSDLVYWSTTEPGVLEIKKFVLQCFSFCHFLIMLYFLLGYIFLSAIITLFRNVI